MYIYMYICIYIYIYIYIYHKLYYTNNVYLLPKHISKIFLCATTLRKWHIYEIVTGEL